MPVPSSQYAQSVGAQIAVAAQTFRGGRLYCDRTFTVTAVKFFVVGASAGDDPTEIGITDGAGNLIAKSLPTLGMSLPTGLKTIPLISPVTLQAGQTYYVGLYANAVTSGFQVAGTFIGTTMAFGRFYGDTAPNVTMVLTAGIVGTLPAAIALTPTVTTTCHNFVLV